MRLNPIAYGVCRLERETLTSPWLSSKPHAASGPPPSGRRLYVVDYRIVMCRPELGRPLVSTLGALVLVRA